jgi:hypothetical protein
MPTLDDYFLEPQTTRKKMLVAGGFAKQPFVL